MYVLPKPTLGDVHDSVPVLVLPYFGLGSSGLYGWVGGWVGVLLLCVCARARSRACTIFRHLRIGSIWLHGVQEAKHLIVAVGGSGVDGGVSVGSRHQTVGLACVARGLHTIETQDHTHEATD